MAARAEELLKEAEKLFSPARLPSFATETPQEAPRKFLYRGREWQLV